MKTGIYKIKNTLNDMCYVGSSNHIERRKTEHIGKLRRNQHKNSYLQNAWNKYGEDNFLFEIIEECSEDNLLIREQFYIDSIKNLYNNTKIAGGRFRAGYKRTDEQKKFMSNIRTGAVVSDETKEKLSKLNIGKKHSEKTKNKISEISKTNWEKLEFRENISEKRRETWSDIGYKERIKKVIAITKDPEVCKKRAEKISNWMKNNPDKMKLRNDKIKKTYIVKNVETGEEMSILGSKQLFETLKITRMMFDYARKKDKLILGKFKIL